MLIEQFINNNAKVFVKTNNPSSYSIIPISKVNTMYHIGWDKYLEDPLLEEQRIARVMTFPLVLTFESNTIEEFTRLENQLIIKDYIAKLLPLELIFIPTDFMVSKQTQHGLKVTLQFLIEEDSEFTAIFLTKGISDAVIDKQFEKILTDLYSNIEDRAEKSLKQLCLNQYHEND